MHLRRKSRQISWGEIDENDRRERVGEVTVKMTYDRRYGVDVLAVKCVCGRIVFHDMNADQTSERGGYMYPLL